MADKLLVAQCKSGSKGALRRVYEKYRNHLLVLAIALSRDAPLAEDALHDVFVAFAQKIASFELRGSLKAYLSTCVANRVRDLVRQSRRRAGALSPQGAHPIELDSNDPSRLIACNEELRLLSAALTELPYEQREVIVLRMHGQLRFVTIAQKLGLPVNTVRGRYRYGIRRLRSVLNGEISQ